MENTTTRKVLLRSIGIFGAALFGTFFAFTHSIPGWVEKSASDHIEAETKKRIDQAIDDIRPPESDSAVARLAQLLYEKNEARIE